MGSYWHPTREDELIPWHSALAAAFGIDDGSVDKAVLGSDQKVYAFLVPAIAGPRLRLEQMH